MINVSLSLTVVPDYVDAQSSEEDAKLPQSSRDQPSPGGHSLLLYHHAWTQPGG